MKVYAIPAHLTGPRADTLRVALAALERRREEIVAANTYRGRVTDNGCMRAAIVDDCAALIASAIGEMFDPKTASDADCEMHIIRKVVEAALAKGFTVSVYDGGAWPVKRSSDITTIMAALRSTDADELMIRGADRRAIGTVQLIYGNAPWEIIADHTDSPKMRELLESAELAAQQIEEARNGNEVD